MTLVVDDCRATLARWAAEGVRVQCVVTSPPYWGLRDYGTAQWKGGDPTCDHKAPRQGRPEQGEEFRRRGEERGYAKGSNFANYGERMTDSSVYRDTCGKCGAERVDQQLGLERTPEEYVARMVDVFRLVRDVLADDGVLWLNLGDCYATGAGKVGAHPGAGEQGARWAGYRGTRDGSPKHANGAMGPMTQPNRMSLPGLKPKDLVGIPWLVAKALQAPYYTGRIKAEADRAWLAGFLDGEGTITYVERDRGEDHTPTHDLRVFLTNCDDGPLRHFAALTAGHVYQHDGEREGRYGGRPCFRWQMGTHDGALLLRELYPHLRTKRRQAALVWTLYTTLRHKNGHARTPAEVVEKRRAIADIVRALNAGAPVDIPEWVEEPPACYEPGWWLRSDVIWAKPNPMPESVNDRPTKAHEYLFLLAKSERYFYDAEAIKEPAIYAGPNAPDAIASPYGQGFTRRASQGKQAHVHAATVKGGDRWNGFNESGRGENGSRNRRSVWTIATAPFPEAHFATFPPDLVKPCILAGSRPGDTVLDPFMGSGTVAMVAQDLGRRWLGCELNPAYAAMCERRTRQAGLELTS